MNDLINRNELDVEVDDTIYFNTDHGLFYSTKRLTKGKGYKVIKINKGFSKFNTYIVIKNDFGHRISIQYDILKDKAIVRKEKIEKLGL